MKILCLSDTHVEAGTAHRQDAIADTDAMFAQVADLAIERGISLVCHAGDVFHRAKPAPAALLCFKRFCDRLAAAEIQMVVIEGNGIHSAAPGQRSALELFESRLVRTSRRPECITEFAGAAVCTLPAATVGQLVARRNGGSREAAYAEAAELLVRAASDLFAEAPDDRPRILVGHQMASGASLPTGLPVEQVGSVVLPLWALEEIGYDAIVLGDLHMAQVLREQPFIGYCGSPWRNDFGEEANEPGVWLLDLDTIGSLHTPAEFVALSDRRFVTVDIDLTAGTVWSEDFDGGDQRVELDETDYIAAQIAERFPLEGAVVRVRYRASEEQRRRVDHAALLRLLEDAGAHRVYGGIQCDVVRERRARAPEVDEGLAPLQAVERWLAAQDAGEGQAAGLRALLGGWLVEAL